MQFGGINYTYHVVQPAPLSISKIFSLPQTETLYPLSNNSPEPMVTSNLFFSSMNLPILGISDKWNYITFVPLTVSRWSQSLQFNKYQISALNFGWVWHFYIYPALSYMQSLNYRFSCYISNIYKLIGGCDLY